MIIVYQLTDNHRIETKLKHWNSVITSACEQSQRTTIPILHSPQPFKTWISSKRDVDVKLILSPVAKNTLKKLKSNIQKVEVAIGSEGGFTQEELQVI